MNTRTRTYLVHARQLPATAALLALFGFAAVAAAGPGWRVTLTDDSRILVTPESSNLLLESSSLDTVVIHGPSSRVFAFEGVFRSKRLDNTRRWR